MKRKNIDLSNSSGLVYNYGIQIRMAGLIDIEKEDTIHS
jgi:hypothetical protein